MRRLLEDFNDDSNKNPIVFLDIAIGSEKGTLRKVINI